MKLKNVWKWWAKSLGDKASECDKESDKIAYIRTIIFFTYLITNIFIISGVVRHWNDSQTIEIYIENPYEVPSYLHQEQEKKQVQTNRNFL